MKLEGLFIMSTEELERVTTIQRVIDKKITQTIAAQHLGLTVRQIKRLVKKFKLNGSQGLISKRRGQPSNHKYSKDKIEEIKTLITRHYYDFGPTFAAEKLFQLHNIKISKETLRTLMIEWGFWKAKKQKIVPIHPLRDRRPCFGELIQIDGSPHDWFEGRGPECCLLVAIDDATSQLCALHFEPSETTAGYFKLMSKHINQHGIPLATYNDKHGIFRINLPNASEESETQFSRAMRQLDIEVICAHSPEAKGRVERANQTLQDRLIKEMRLRGINDIETANAFLPTYIKAHNKRFAVTPLNPENVHRQEKPKDELLNLIFSFHEERKLSKNLEFSYKNMIYQIKTNTKGYRLRHTTVTVCEDLDGQVSIVHQGKILDYSCHKRARANPDIINAKELNKKINTVRKQTQYKPKANHPWRFFVINPEKAELKAQKNACKA
jgi:transposase